jgi:hypothetical protein
MSGFGGSGFIANATTKTGLKIRAELDSGSYPAGIEVSDEDLAALRLKRANFTVTGTTQSCQLT